MIERRLLTTALGLAASHVVPRLSDRAHPVARFGAAMQRIEDRWWADRRDAGVAYALAGAALGAVAGRVVGATATVAVCAAGAQLRATASEVCDHLDRGDLDAARAALPALVGRDPSELDESGVAAAVIESVAENMVDAVFGTVFWSLVAGGPGAGAHRALNTLDAMVGHHSERHERFGWASARADDAANLAPARLFAATAALLSPDPALVLEIVRRDARRHPSPNAGVAESAMAAALGCSVGGPLRYGDRHEDRPALGSGPRPDVTTARRSIELAARAELAAGALLVVAAAGLVLGARSR